LFDDIAYGKAGSVIGMVENWVGDDVFRKGVQEYLAAHLYGSASAEDFWEAQARVSGLPVDKVMRGFVEQPGVPLVTLGSGVGAAGDAAAVLSVGHAPGGGRSVDDSSLLHRGWMPFADSGDEDDGCAGGCLCECARQGLLPDRRIRRWN